MNCKLHPTYKAKMKPRSTKKGCTCQEVWEAKKPKKPKPKRPKPYRKPTLLPKLKGARGARVYFGGAWATTFET